MDEFSLIASAISCCSKEALSGKGVDLGAGDDAAVLSIGDELLVVSVDSFVEEVHFSRAWMSAEQIGARAIEGSVSDIAAMGAAALYVLVQLGCPAEEGLEGFIQEIYRGVDASCKRNSVVLIGGDLTSSKNCILGVTAIGRVPHGQKPVKRSGMRPGDKVCVSGPVGGSAAGLVLCQQGSKEPAACLKAFTEPQARTDIGPELGRFATAMIDLSDGLSSELHHLANQSNCGIRLYQEKIPFIPELKIVAEKTGVDLFDWVLHGGEDYQLLYSLPEDVEPVEGSTVIGEACKESGVLLINSDRPDGYPLEVGGYRHLSAT